MDSITKKSSKIDIIPFFTGFLTIFHVNIIFPPIISIFLVCILLGSHLLSKELKISKKLSKVYLRWYGGFSALVLLSCIYTVNSLNPDYVVRRVLITFILGFIVSQTVYSQNSFLSLAKGLVCGNLVITLLCFYKEGILNFGAMRLGTVTVGSAVNLSGLLLVGFICSLIIYFVDLYKPKRYLFFCVLFLITDVLSGSRRSVILCVVFFVMYILVNKQVKKNKKIIALIIILGAITVAYNYIMTNENIYRIFGYRFSSLLNSINGSEIDASSNERNGMKSLAMSLFMERPILGWGCHGFAYFYNKYAGILLFSHCGFTEILSCYGIVGFGIFYSVFYRLFKKIRKHFFQRTLLEIYLGVYIAITLISEFYTMAFISPQVIIMITATLNVIDYSRMRIGEVQE